MMDSSMTDQHSTMDENESPALVTKIKRLSNGTNEQDTDELTHEAKSPSGNLLENGTAYNGTRERGAHDSDSRDRSDVSEDGNLPISCSTGTARGGDKSFGNENDSVSERSKYHSKHKRKSKSTKGVGDCKNVASSSTSKNCDSVIADNDSEDPQVSSGRRDSDPEDPQEGSSEKDNGGSESVSSKRDNSRRQDDATLDYSKPRPDDKTETNVSPVVLTEQTAASEEHEDMDTETICVIASVSGDVSEEAFFDNAEKEPDGHTPHMEQDAAETEDKIKPRDRRVSERKSRKNLNKDKGGVDRDMDGLNKNASDQGSNGKSLSKNKEAADSEKENIDKEGVVDYSAAVESEGKSHKRNSPEGNMETKQADKQGKRSDVAGDDIEIIGESKMVHVKTPKSLYQTSQNIVFVPNSTPDSGAGQPVLNQGSTPTTSNLVASSAIQGSPMNQGLVQPSMLHGIAPGLAAHRMPTLPPGFTFPAGVPGQVTPIVSVAPPKPKSSLDQIELIRWEIQNRINTRPKYFKPNSSSELGPLAKFLFDIGSDIIKESVYHDLVKIQSKKKGADKLNAKEKEDLEKLKEIEKDLHATIGHLKLKLKKKCKVCHFQTESHNVMFYHKQYPHEDNKFLKCAHCSFSTKQSVTFKFHLEAEHAIQPKLYDKKAFFECDLCPYENNQEQKLTLHKQRCLKQFRPLFNLHPSCLSGAEINLCLENIFYRPVIPKNLKLLQQKHAQQQAALAEARRQQAQMQVLAAQKNAAAVAARKQQQSLQKRVPAPAATRAAAPTIARMPAPTKSPGQQQNVRYNATTSAKAPCPTVATMLNAKQTAAATAPSPGAASSTTAGGFEVCEICGGYVKDRKALRIHFFYAHRIDLPFNLFERNQAPLYCATCYVRFWTAHGLRKHIDTHKEENQTRGVVGKCISCGHHVLNLLLHMRVVHNREMQHYINALMCMFCGSHFGSHQECERHILKVHGHVDPTTGTLKSAPNAPPQQQTPKTPVNNKKPVNSNLVKGSVCVLCNLNFGRNVDLTRHCMRMHHTCMKCGMVVIDKASLMKHTCLSSPSGTRDCTMCGESGFHPAYYVKHLRDKHLKRFSVRVRKLDKKIIEQWTKRPYPFTEPEILVEISDSDDDVVVEKKANTPPQATAAKKPRIGPACKIGRQRVTPQISDAPASDNVVVICDDTDVEVKDSVKEDVAPTETAAPTNCTSSIEEPAAPSEKLTSSTEETTAPTEELTDSTEKSSGPSVEDSDTAPVEVGSVAENEISSESTPSAGKKRKLDVESPESETSSKRKK